MKKVALLLFFPFYFSTVYGQIDSLSLEMLYDLTRENYQGLEKVDYLEEILTKESAILRSDYFPQLNLNAQISYQSDVIEFPFELPGSHNIEFPHDHYKAYGQVTQVIYQGGNRKFQNSLNEIQSKISTQQIEVDFMQLKSNLLQSFYALLLARQKDRSYRETISFLQSKLNVLRSAYEDGVTTEQDTLRMYLEVLDMKNSILQQEEEIELLIEQLEILTGKELMTSVRLISPDISEPIQAAVLPTEIAELLDLRSDLLSSKQEIYKSARMPHIQAFAEGGLGYPNPLNMLQAEASFYGIVGLKVQWRVWDWGRLRKKQEIAALRMKVLEKDKAVLDKRRSIKLNSYKHRIDKLKKAMTSTNEKLLVQKRIRKQSEIQLENGVSSVKGFLDDVHKYNRIKLQAQQLKIQLLFAKAKYLDATGHLFN